MSMKYNEMLKKIKTLGFDKEEVIVTQDGVDVFVFRPSKLGKRFENYDVKKNFQIWLRDGERTFRPNHLRVMIDLNLRIRSRSDLKRQLLLTFDEIFYGICPDEAIKKTSMSANMNFIFRNIGLSFKTCSDRERRLSRPSTFRQGEMWLIVQKSLSSV